jgi:DNA-binding PadR family transcriptional regulator
MAEGFGRQFGGHGGGEYHRGGRGGGGGRGDGQGDGMRRRRMFDGGELRLVLLKLIADEPRHGYELIKSIEEMTGGGYAPSPGIIYPTLTMLNESGQVASADTGNGRRKFTISPEGEAYLAEQAEVVAALILRLSTLGERNRQTDGAPVRRAIANLRAAVQGRLERGDATDAMLLDVAGLIDEAARKIERL